MSLFLPVFNTLLMLLVLAFGIASAIYSRQADQARRKTYDAMSRRLDLMKDRIDIQAQHLAAQDDMIKALTVRLAAAEKAASAKLN